MSKFKILFLVAFLTFGIGVLVVSFWIIKSKSPLESPSENSGEQINSDVLVMSDDKEIRSLLNTLGDEKKLNRADAKSKLIQLLNESKEKRRSVTDSISRNINEICGNGLSNDMSERILNNILDILLETKPEETYDTLARNIDCGGLIGGLSRSRQPILSILPEFGDDITPRLKNVLINGAITQRNEAALILGQIHSDEARKALKEAYEQEKDGRIKQNIRYALER